MFVSGTKIKKITEKITEIAHKCLYEANQDFNLTTEFFMVLAFFRPAAVIEAIMELT